MSASKSHVELAIEHLYRAEMSIAESASSIAHVHATLALAEQVARIADFLDAIPIANNDAPIVVTRYGGEA